MLFLIKGLDFENGLDWNMDTALQLSYWLRMGEYGTSIIITLQV